eukprot:gene7991-1215_t
MTEWLFFCTESKAFDKTAKKGITVGDVQVILDLFEFYEALVRFAFGKFINHKGTDDASDAVLMLLDQVLIPNVPPAALLDPNEFRRNRMYNESMDLVALYYLYKAKNRSKYFDMEHYKSMLTATCLLGKHTGIEVHTAKLAFIWSKLVVSDELGQRERANSLGFFDFVEAMARLADLMSSPTIEEVTEALTDSGMDAAEVPQNMGTCYLAYYQLPHREKSRRASATLMGPPTRPLAEKFGAMMSYVAAVLKEEWAGKTHMQTAANMLKAAKNLHPAMEREIS